MDKSFLVLLGPMVTSQPSSELTPMMNSLIQSLLCSGHRAVERRGGESRRFCIYWFVVLSRYLSLPSIIVSAAPQAGG